MSETAPPPAANGPNSGAWEAAYLAFETPEEEVSKFVGRLRRLGAEAWPKEARVVELFCGRGSGLKALDVLGFNRIEGVDLSARLLAEYTGPGRIELGDCRRLNFPDTSRDIVIVQGGLHHLANFPRDLERTLAEVRRVLRSGGRFLVVEPWLTPFLRMVHLMVRQPVFRQFSRKLNALHTMIELEWRTYHQWLGQPERIRTMLDGHFETELWAREWGKLLYLGRKPPGEVGQPLGHSGPHVSISTAPAATGH